MRRVFSLSVLLFAIFAGTVSFAAQRDTLRVLAIGNSFSVNAVEQNLHSIADADGVCLIIGNMYIGGCSLERHFNNSKTGKDDYSYRKINQYGVRTVASKVTLEKALADEDWDIVTFQQSSPMSGFYDTYEPFFTDLLSFVKARTKSGVRFFWHQTWAYAKDASHERFIDYDRDQDKMFNMIMDASSKACKTHCLGIIPCGATIQNVRASSVGDNLTRDGYHLNNLGCYAAACTWYQALVDKANVVGNVFRPQYISEEEVLTAQKAAFSAVKKPFGLSR